MKTTLFVTDIPFNVTETDFVNLFSNSDGFITARLRPDKNQNIVGFVEFDDEITANQAKSDFHLYKFTVNDTGLNVRFSNPRSTNKRNNIRDRDSLSPNSHASLPPPQSHPHGHLHGGVHPHPTHPAATQTLVSHERGSGNSPSINSSPSGIHHHHHHHQQQQMLVNEPNGPMYPPASMGVNNGYSGVPGSSYFMQQPFQNNSYPPEASTTLYVEGLPLDATEREVAHIFRPFPGYQSLRILRKESKQNPSRVYNLCFVEFDSKYQATVSMNALNGYKMDKSDTKGLKISYAKNERRERRTTNTPSNNNGNNSPNTNGNSNQYDL